MAHLVEGTSWSHSSSSSPHANSIPLVVLFSLPFYSMRSYHNLLWFLSSWVVLFSKSKSTLPCIVLQPIIFPLLLWISHMLLYKVSSRKLWTRRVTKRYMISTCIWDLLLLLDASWLGRRPLVYLLYHFDIHQLGHEWILPLLWYHHIQFLCRNTSIRCPFCCPCHLLWLCDPLSNTTSMALLVSVLYHCIYDGICLLIWGTYLGSIGSIHSPMVIVLLCRMNWRVNIIHAMALEILFPMVLVMMIGITRCALCKVATLAKTLYLVTTIFLLQDDSVHGGDGHLISWWSLAFSFSLRLWTVWPWKRFS